MTKVSGTFIKKNFTKRGVPIKRKDQPPKQEKPKDSPPLPLEVIPYTKDELDLKKRSQYTLKAVPNDPNSGELKSNVYHIDGTEGTRQAINWLKDMRKVLKGLNINDPESAKQVIEDCCEGLAKTAFQNQLTAFAEEKKAIVDLAVEAVDPNPANTFAARQTAARQAAEDDNKFSMDDIHGALEEVVTAVAPKDALYKQKQQMKYMFRRPHGMTTRTYYGLITRINKEELPFLSPFDETQILTEQEIRDIVLRAIPARYKSEMTTQDFSYHEANLDELVAFAERLEEVDSTPPSNKDAKSETPKAPKKPTGKWCEIHKSPTHDTVECRDFKKQGNGDHKGKPWKRNADDSKTYTKQELHAIVKKAIDFGRKNHDKKPAAKRRVQELHAMDDEYFMEVDVDEVAEKDFKLNGIKSKTKDGNDSDSTEENEFTWDV